MAARPLTPDQLSDACARFLPQMERLVFKKYGPNAVEFVGEALFETLQAFDASKGSLESWVASKVCLKVTDALRKVTGRQGSARHTAGRNAVALEDFDEDARPAASPDDSPDHEGTARVLKAIEEAHGLSRWVLVGYCLGDFRRVDLLKVLRVSASNISRAASGISRHLPPGRCDDAARRVVAV